MSSNQLGVYLYHWRAVLPLGQSTLAQLAATKGGVARRGTEAGS